MRSLMYYHRLVACKSLTADVARVRPFTGIWNAAGELV